MAEQHSSRGIMIGTIVAAVVLMAIVVPFTIKGDQSAAIDGDADSADVRIQPVAKFALKKEAAPAAGAAPRDGATVYNTICAACHNTGAAGAPKAGDKAAWGARLAQGDAALYNSALNGKGAMPPKGGGADLSEAEVKAAVDFLVGKAK